MPQGWSLSSARSRVCRQSNVDLTFHRHDCDLARKGRTLRDNMCSTLVGDLHITLDRHVFRSAEQTRYNWPTTLSTTCLLWRTPTYPLFSRTSFRFSLFILCTTIGIIGGSLSKPITRKHDTNDWRRIIHERWGDVRATSSNSTRGGY